MSKHDDFANIGDVYGKMLNGVKHKLVYEGKTKPKVKPGQIGDVPLIAGGPNDTQGYMPAKIDKKNLKNSKDSKENSYNIDKLSYDEDEEGKKHLDRPGKEDSDVDNDGDSDKSDKYLKKRRKVIAGSIKGKAAKSEEKIQESQKIAQKSLNNFMRKKSYFDKLFENVMTGGGAGPQMGGSPTGPSDDMGMDDADELDALGIEDEMGDEDGMGDVTFTLPKDVAQQLIDVLSAAIGGEEGGDEFEGEFGDDEYGDDEGDDGDVFGDEDEETMGTPGVNAKQPDMGKNNKVGNLKKASGSAYTSKQGPDGDHGHALVNAKQPDMGKNNKVGSLKTGKSMFEQ